MAGYFWMFVVAMVAGVLMIASGGKHKAPGEKEWPASVQWGYILLLAGFFGVLSNWMSFSAVMLVIVLITGFGWALDRFYLARRRAPGEEPGHVIDNAKGFFPIILVVFLLRAFVVEPFQIPSSSMRPGLVVGDFILVNKFDYGLRVPVLNKVMVPVGEVARGDVVVFNFPPNPRVDYIKRVIGLPGDTVEYRNKRLTINGQPVPDVDDGTYEYLEQGLAMIRTDQFVEKLPSTPAPRSYKVVTTPDTPVYDPQQVRDFPYRDNCKYEEDGFTCKVPDGHYFMLGDNRDNSLDSRYWGFVADDLLVGKAFLIWLNFKDFSRIGQKIH